MYISAERGFLRMTRQKELLGKVALDDISGVIIRGYGATISANICAHLAASHVPIIICGSDQLPASVVWPINGNFQQGIHMQAQADAKKPLCKRLWSALVQAKITNQALVLGYDGKENADVLAMAARVKSGDADNVEAQAARRYWKRLLGSDFKRDRQQHGINAALNYGYTVLRAATARSILVAGLHPSLSIHHQSRGDALRLADDLMEPFRPFVDLVVLGLVTAQQTAQDIELNKETKSRLVAVLSLDLKSCKGTSPLQLCLDRLAQSLVAVFMGQQTKLELPQAPFALHSLIKSNPEQL